MITAELSGVFLETVYQFSDNAFMPEANPFNIDGKPINIARRSWQVHDPWGNYFPMDEKGVVTFAAPWRSPVLLVENKRTALALIGKLKRGLLTGAASLLLASGLVFFLFWRTPWFLGAGLLTLWFVQFALRNWWLPRTVRGICPEAPGYENISITRRLDGKKRAPGTDGRILTACFFVGATLAAAINWQECRDIAFIASLSASIIAVMVGLVFFYLLKGRGELPAKLMFWGTSLVICLGWAVLCWLWVSPPEPRVMGAWGKTRQSPPSEVLAHMESIIGPVSWDRRMMNAGYRGQGARLDWAFYNIDPALFGQVRDSLLGNESVKVRERQDNLDRKLWNKLTKISLRQRFPEWWNVTEGVFYLRFAFIPGKELEGDSRKVEFHYADGTSSILPHYVVSPQNLLEYELIYDHGATKLYFSIRQEMLSPLGQLSRRLD